jgi:4-amino-4-deoxy-L-arabinose transferase-like glycosyltransferase
VRRVLPARRRHRLALAAILVVAVALRCVYLPEDTSIVDQSGIQGTIAHNILAGHWFAINPQQYSYVNELLNRIHHFPDPADVKYPASAAAQSDWRPFIAEVMGPALMLAAVWEVTGSERFIYGKVLQIAIDLGVLLLIYRIAMLLFRRRRTALIAAALYAVCFPIARQTSIVDPDIWALYFTVAILALYLEALRAPGRRLWWLLACGLTVGVGAFFRPNVLLLPLALGIASIRWPGVKRPLRNASAVFAVAVLLLVPWTIRNYVVFHRFIPTRSGSGVVLWQGLGETHNDFGAIDDDWATYLEVHRVRPNLEYESPAYDEYLRGRALHAIEQHPLHYAQLLARRAALSTVALYESAWMYKGGESPFLYRTRTGKGLFSYIVNRPLALLESAFESGIFVLAMLALACTWRRYRREHLLLIAVVLSALLPYWLLHVEARYALPTLPVYLLWIALGAELLGERAMQRLTPARVRPARPAPA